MDDELMVPRDDPSADEAGRTSIVPPKESAPTELDRDSTEPSDHVLSSRETQVGRPMFAHPILGHTLGSYYVSEVLGEGGFGTVYKAEDRSLGRPVALKFLRDTLDPRRLQLFKREAKALAALGKHPSIVQIYADGDHEGHAYFALEYVESSAASLLESHPAGLSVEQALELAAQCADGLGFAHENSILHRDIKPANILVEPDGRAKLADFGLARFVESGESTMSGVLSGSPSYMSPEQAGGHHLDKRTDVFSLGVTLYELLTGKRPFDGQNAIEILDKIRSGDAVPLGVRRPDLPKMVTDLVDRAMAQDPVKRFQSADDMAAALRATLSALRKGVEEASTWLERSITDTGSDAAEDVVCGVCNRTLVSAQLVRGHCAETGSPICYKCWALGKRSADTGNEAPEAGAESVPESTPTAPGCEAAEAAGDAEALFTPGEALALETVFHQTMAQALRDAGPWPEEPPIPLAGLHEENEWQAGRLRESDLPTRAQREAFYRIKDDLPPNRGVRLRAEFARPGIWPFRKRKTVYFDLVSITPPAAVLGTGDDSPPVAGGREISQVTQREDAPRTRPRLTFVFSPTGWQEALPIPAETVLVRPDGEGGLAFRHAVRGESARAYVEAVFEREHAPYHVEQCRAAVQAESTAGFPLSAKAVAEQEGLPVEAAIEAFRQEAAERSDALIVCEDPDKGDWLLDLR